MKKVLRKTVLPLIAVALLIPSLAFSVPMNGSRGGIGPAGPTGPAGAVNDLLMDAPKTRYVTKNGNDSNDGKSWDKAKLTIRNAVESLPEEGTGGSARKAGDIYIGEGLFVENGTGLTAGEPIIEASSNIRFHGSGIPVSSDGVSGGTHIKVADGSNRHLFGPRIGFTDWGHMIIFENMRIDGNKANNVGAFDLVRITRPGFNTAMYNVAFSSASRYCLKIIDNAVNFYGHNLTGAGCETAFFHLNLGSSASTTNIGFFGTQVDDSGNYPFQIDSSSNGVGNFFIHGLETEALGNDDQHRAVIQYTPTAGVNGLNISISDVFSFKGDNPAQTGQAVIEVAAGSGADPIIIWKQVIQDGYDHVFKHVDASVTSSAREFCYVRGSTLRFCLDAAKILMEGLPTSDPSNPGQIWDSAGDLRVSQ